MPKDQLELYRLGEKIRAGLVVGGIQGNSYGSGNLAQCTGSTAYWVLDWQGRRYKWSDVSPVFRRLCDTDPYFKEFFHAKNPSVGVFGCALRSLEELSAWLWQL